MNWSCPSQFQSVLVWSLAALTLLRTLNGHAQPSGGPYGPLPQTYAVPKDAAHVYYVAPDGKADAAGTSLAEPTTLEAAITKVVTGDAIILRGGTYRVGGLQFNQGITLQPYADEQPVLKGTRVADKWDTQGNGLFSTTWSNLFPMKPQSWWRRDREGRKTPLWLFNNDMVFVDGRPLKTVGWDGAVDTNSFYIDYDAGRVYIGINPANHLVEITAYDGALTRVIGEAHGKASDHKGPIIRGLTFTQYAYRALEVEGTEPQGLADPATFGKDVIGTTLENLTISHCSRVAGYFRGDKFTMRNCLITDTSTEGVYLIASSDCLLEKNIFARNNVEEITGYFPSAVKIFNQTRRVTCRDNLVLDNPHSNGIWYDVGNVDGVFVNNWVENCQDGFFFEISKGAICAGNVFVNCDKGVRVLNSSNVRVYHNTLINTVASIERTERSAVNDHFGWHPSTGPDVDQREGHVFMGNLIVADASLSGPLLRFEQAAVLCGKLTRPQVKQLDDNVYVRSGDQNAGPLLTWSPEEGSGCKSAFATPAEFQKAHPEFEAHSQYYPGWYGSVVKSTVLKRCELIRPFPKPIEEDSLPADIQQLLGWSKADARTPGAYPLRP
ncbi:MAG TPA: right-handed parallel beta-helix repeat-containing protein [Candidatus Acidoferrum sp.]|nr:right-handed parallel beta-helix repeat-containing protein [Candidatus Acidoferrum sp.]